MKEGVSLSSLEVVVVDVSLHTNPAYLSAKTGGLEFDVAATPVSRTSAGIRLAVCASSDERKGSRFCSSSMRGLCTMYAAEA